MSEYHKIQTIFKRDMSSRHKTLIEGDWTTPEFAFLADNVWTFTEKVDGTNIRIIFQGGKLTFGGRTDAAQMPANLVTRLNERFLPRIDQLATMFGDADSDAVLYGEGYGAQIQKVGASYRADQDFILFDVRVGSWWLQRADVLDIAEKLGLDAVPIVGEGSLRDAVDWAKRGIQSQWGNFEAEGIVARPKTELQTRAGKRIIAKIKCRDFRT